MEIMGLPQSWEDAGAGFICVVNCREMVQVGIALSLQFFTTHSWSSKEELDIISTAGIENFYFSKFEGEGNLINRPYTLKQRVSNAKFFFTDFPQEKYLFAKGFFVVERWQVFQKFGRPY